MFSGTNLLASCQSASFLFSSVFGFRKASKEIFSELDGTKDKINISPRRTRRLEEIWRGATGWPHTPRRGLGWASAQAGCGPPGGPMGNRRFSKKSVSTCWSVLTDFCHYLHLLLIDSFLGSFWEIELFEGIATVACIFSESFAVLKLNPKVYYLLNTLMLLMKIV